MANTHGVLILIGFTDQDRRIVGVPPAKSWRTSPTCLRLT
jgi:hypothetical protein